jgi:hypothetical protein
MLCYPTVWKQPFRFYNKEADKNSVIETTTVSLSGPQYVSFIALCLDSLALYLRIDIQYITYAIWILVFDALVIIPFSKLRATKAVCLN